MNSENIIDTQNQIRVNSEELEKYLTDLESWEKDMKKKEEELKLIQTTLDEEIPPIRNSMFRSKKKNRHKKQKEKVPPSNKMSKPATDYQAWDKFDADSELKKIDEEAKPSSASENSENEDEFCIQKRKQLAILHKDKGNNFFKSGNYQSAINSYTTGLQLDPENPLLAANRAMAFLKTEQYQAAENDCTLCLSIDPTYVKAYMRRGTARKNLQKFSLAKSDFMKALEFEPGNKQALAELEKFSQEFTTDETSKITESEVVEAQEIWPRFLGNKVDKNIEKSVEEKKETLGQKKENSCIFPDARKILPQKDAPSINDLNSRTRIGILEVDEKTFISTVEDSLKDLKDSFKDKRDCSLNKENHHEEKLKDAVPPLPPVPTTSFQFLTDWNEIAPYPDLRYKYLKQFPPQQFPVLFKLFMEPTIFPLILETLSSFFIENGDDVFDYLKYLAGVGRFNTMIMFLSEKEEKDLKKIIESIKISGRSDSEISEVLKKYNM